MAEKRGGLSVQWLLWARDWASSGNLVMDEVEMAYRLGGCIGYVDVKQN